MSEQQYDPIWLGDDWRVDVIPGNYMMQLSRDTTLWETVDRYEIPAKIVLAHFDEQDPDYRDVPWIWQVIVDYDHASGYDFPPEQLPQSYSVISSTYNDNNLYDFFGGDPDELGRFATPEEAYGSCIDYLMHESDLAEDEAYEFPQRDDGPHGFLGRVRRHCVALADRARERSGMTMRDRSVLAAAAAMLLPVALSYATVFAGGTGMMEMPQGYELKNPSPKITQFLRGVHTVKPVVIRDVGQILQLTQGDGTDFFVCCVRNNLMSIDEAREAIAAMPGWSLPEDFDYDGFASLVQVEMQIDTELGTTSPAYVDPDEVDMIVAGLRSGVVDEAEYDDFRYRNAGLDGGEVLLDPQDGGDCDVYTIVGATRGA